MSNSSGVALLIVLLIMQVLVIIGLCALKIALLEKKQSGNFEEIEQLYNLSDNELVKIEKELMIANPSCVQAVTVAQSLPSLPLSWWQQSSICAEKINQVQYYYFLEFLGSDSCAILQAKPKKISANYFRVTLLSVNSHAKVLVQVTEALANTVAGKCDGQYHHVNYGRQMWRQLR